MKQLLLHKTDGLGARLREILVGLTLSRLLGRSLAIKWDTSGLWVAHRGWQEHLDQDMLFDTTWFERYLDKSERNQSPLIHAHWPLNRFDKLRFSYDSRDVLLKKVPKDPSRLISFKSEQGVRRLLQEAFEGIGFSDPARQALEAGRARAPVNGVAVHVRQGDVVKGEYRFHGNWTNKAIPAPVAAFISRKIARGGQRPVLVSADEDFHEWEDVTADKAAIRAEKPSSPIEAMFYDIGLMSGCESIVMGADCNFGLIAAWSRNRAIHAASEFISPSELQQITTDLLDGSLDAPDALDLAYTGQWLLIQHRDALREEQREALLDLSRKSDPDNPVYYVINAAQALIRGKEHEAETQARAAVAARKKLDDYVDKRFATDFGYGANRLLDKNEAMALVEYPTSSGSSLAVVREWVRECSMWRQFSVPLHTKVLQRSSSFVMKYLRVIR